MISLARVTGLVALLVTIGCGPIVSGVQMVNVNIALSAAETAGAKKYALYEYTAAREYLQKAREENAYSDFWAARIYADKALEYAAKARKRAESASSAEQVPVMSETTNASSP